MLSFDPNKVEFSTGNYIDGQYCHKNQGQIPVHRPSDGQSYADIPESGAQVVAQAVEIAEQQRIRSGWSEASPRQRGQYYAAGPI